MKHQLLTFDYVFWYVTIVCEVVACIALIRRKQFFQHWKVFGYYFFYIASASILTAAVEQFGSPSAFRITYSVVELIEAILLNLVLLEILVKVLAPLTLCPAAPWPILFLGSAGHFNCCGVFSDDAFRA